MENNISFSKIVATPTLNSWSQAYNAGKLFAVLSLEKTEELNETIESLNIFGKDLLERLEQEFFVIEDKNLDSIKKAISSIFEKEVQGVAISFACGAFVNNILYLFGLGNAKVFIKRGDNLGLALNCEDAISKNVSSSSGFLNDNDLIVLATEAFSQVVTNEELNLNLNNNSPEAIAESLAPKIHKAENGKISAIVIKYGNQKTVESAEILEEENLPADSAEVGEIQENKMEKPLSSFGKYLTLLKSRLKNLNINFKPTNKLFLIAAIIIVGILIASVFLAIREQNNAKIRKLFAEIYPSALKKYDEGQGLLDLNKSFARDSFLSAQKILTENKDKFPEKSKELAQTQDLLKKIESGLVQVSPIDKSGLDRSKLSIIVQNGSGIEGTAGKAAAILKELGYNVVSTGNADNYNYEGINIKVKKEKNNFIDLLKKDLSKDYTIKETSSDLPSSSPTDSLIIIGK